MSYVDKAIISMSNALEKTLNILETHQEEYNKLVVICKEQAIQIKKLEVQMESVIIKAKIL